MWFNSRVHATWSLDLAPRQDNKQSSVAVLSVQTRCRLRKRLGGVSRRVRYCRKGWVMGARQERETERKKKELSLCDVAFELLPGVWAVCGCGCGCSNASLRRPLLWAAALAQMKDISLPALAMDERVDVKRNPNLENLPNRGLEEGSAG